MVKTLASLGIGTYYAWQYAAYLAVLAAMSTTVYLARKRLSSGIRFSLGWIVAIVLIRLMLFENPVMLKWYQRHVTPGTLGGRQWGVLDLEIEKYRRDLHQPKLANLAVGSSQVGAIFSHWVSDPPQPLKVFSLAGMKTLDYVLYEEDIAAYNPARVILYLSAFDLTAQPELYSLPLAPSRPSSVLPLVWRLRSAGLDLGDYSTEVHAFIASQLFPEYRFSFLFRTFLKELFRESPARRSAATTLPARRFDASIAPAVFFYQPDWPTVLVARHSARVVPTAASMSPQTDPSLAPEHINEFVSYYVPEWLDYNYAFLKDFVEFCRSHAIDVVIAEGQINPVVKSAKVDALNQMVRWRFAELEAQFSNVTFIPAADVYQFASSDYHDLTHVELPAAMRYTQRLSSRLAPPVARGVCGAAFVSGWHEKELSGTDWFRWSNGAGTIRMTSLEPSDLILEGKVLSFARPNTVDVIVDDRNVATWRIDDPAWKFQPFPKVEFHVDAGAALSVRFVSHASPVRQPSDPRPLTIALSNVTVRRKADSTRCDVNADLPGELSARPWR